MNLREQSLPRDLCYVENEAREDYLHDMRICQRWAVLNRKLISLLLLKFFSKVSIIEEFESVHNYISNDNIIRKGSISAAEGERCIIPLNMRDGSLLCTGKGNPDWNCSAPHGPGKISHRALYDKWERCKDLSDCKPLHRATFNRWRDAIYSQFGIIIDCQRVGGYLYFIANPEDIDVDELKKWMLDSFAVGNLIGEHLSLKYRILVDQIPSGRNHLTTLLEAMKENRVDNIEYKAFKYSRSFIIPVEPYCVKLHENRWYMLGHNLSKDTIRLYGLDRIETIEKS